MTAQRHAVRQAIFFSLVMILLGLEIMLNAASVAFVGSSLRWLHLDGQAMVLFIMAVAAAEAAVGLAIATILFRNRQTVMVDLFDRMKG